MTGPDASSIALPTDVQLVGEVLAGNRQAFNDLVLRHERRLFRFLVTNAACQADAEDAMQQAWVKAYLNLGKYNPKWRFTTWLFTIAVRELRSQARTIRPKVMSLDRAQDCACAPVTQGNGDSDLWKFAKRILSEGQYAALWLRYGEDLAVRDIARITRRPRVWVSVNLHRACSILRRHLLDVPKTVEVRDDQPIPSID